MVLSAAFAFMVVVLSMQIFWTRVPSREARECPPGTTNLGAGATPCQRLPTKAKKGRPRRKSADEILQCLAKVGRPGQFRAQLAPVAGRHSRPDAVAKAPSARSTLQPARVVCDRHAPSGEGARSLDGEIRAVEATRDRAPSLAVDLDLAGRRTGNDWRTRRRRGACLHAAPEALDARRHDPQVHAARLRQADRLVRHRELQGLGRRSSRPCPSRATRCACRGGARGWPGAAAGSPPAGGTS